LSPLAKKLRFEAVLERGGRIVAINFANKESNSSSASRHSFVSRQAECISSST
jgi:hypothetical protein